MSETFHQHLQHLTLWEQIDRFFNPAKYSCSAPFINDNIWHIFLGIAGVAVILAVIAFALIKLATVGDARLEN